MSKAKKALSESHGSLAAKRVLVIDDSEKSRAVLSDILGAQGYEVSLAEDGRAGVTQAALTHPDLVLCDILMPGMNGYEVLSALRKQPSTATTPVIFLTAVGGPEAVRLGMNLGADDYLEKPVKPEALIAAVAARLERTEAVRRESERRLETLRDDLTRTLLPHVFMTPLTAVMGLGSLLMEEGAIEARDTKAVGRGILEACETLAELIERFLAYAELHATTSIIAVSLQPEKALETAREEARFRALRADRSQDLVVSGEPTRVPMGADHWRLLVRELVDNALKFSPRGSYITLDLTTYDGEATLSILDNGKGMSAECLDSLEDRAPFLKREPGGAGLGLGLSLVRRLLGMYGGALSFDTNTREGTTARVRFLAPPFDTHQAKTATH